jgi:hypothetical protein
MKIFWLFAWVVFMSFNFAPINAGAGNNIDRAKTESLSMIQNPVAQAMVKQYLDVLADDPVLQQKVMSCAVNQISQSQAAQEILGVNSEKLQKAVQNKNADLKKILITIKQVFQPCLEIMNNNLRIQ